MQAVACQARPLLAGAAKGPLLFSGEPLSLWGGLDPRTGEIIDRRHELSGAVVSGRILALPHGRGSSTASGILLEAIRLGTAPAALLLLRVDQILALGAIVARELYGKTLPMLVLAPADFESLRGVLYLHIGLDGAVRSAAPPSV